MERQKKTEYEHEELGKLIDICHSNLLKSSESIKYLSDRGLDSYIIKKYKLGYFPQNLSKLSEYVNFDLLKSKNIVRANGSSDFAEYHSIIFPIFNEYGDAIGISGRATLDSDTLSNLSIPKYKNSSYKKSNVLYGLNNSIECISEKKCAFVVEGYFDQIAMYKNNIKNSVAICGTAFSKGHYMKLRRFCDRIYFVLDNDDAGYRSSISIYNKFMKYGLDLKFLKCSDKNIKDVDEYFKVKNFSSFKKDFKLISLF